MLEMQNKGMMEGLNLSRKQVVTRLCFFGNLLFGGRKSIGELTKISHALDAFSKACRTS